jgi:hypothetical protein
MRCYGGLVAGKEMKFNFETTGIGSLPFKDPDTACRIVFDNFKTIPFWPQLPRISYKEHMYCQFSEKLPGVVINENKKTIYVDSKKAASSIEAVYQKYLEADIEYFKISESYAEGFYRFLDLFEKNDSGAQFVKGHVTGPVSFALSVTDENKKAIIYDDDLFDVATKILSMKARWQIRRLKTLKEKVIIFIDEPYLVSIGSGFINLPLEGVIKALDEIASSIRLEGAVSGLHCCGNTDWSALLKRGIDILNFDAYNFMKEFCIYAEDIKSFTKSGGTIAWGIVPSSEAIDKETTAAIAKNLKDGLQILADKGVEKKMISSLITPSCGLGTLDEKRAEKIIEYVNKIPGFNNK